MTAKTDTNATAASVAYQKAVSGGTHTLKFINIGPGEQAKWTECGRICNEDHPEYLPEKICWPDLELLEKDQNSIYLIAEKNGQLVGRLMIRDGFIIELAVTPKERRKQIGSKLLEKGIDQIRERGIKTISYFGYLDEEEEGLMAFFIKNKFTYAPRFSKEINLMIDFPEDISEKADGLGKEGFKYYIVKANDEMISEIAFLQAKYFPGFPSFFTPERMVKIMHQNGLISIIIKKGNQNAGFVTGGYDIGIKNYRHVQEHGTGLLTSIAISEEFRGQGLGILLGYLLMDLCKKKGNKRLIYGGCQSWGRPSWKLASKLGGRKILHQYKIIREL